MNVLLVPYLAALALFIAELRGWLATREVALPRPNRAPVLVGVLIATYALQIAVMRYAATHGVPALPAWRLSMPFPIVFLHIAHADAVTAAFLMCAALQTLALATLYRTSISNRALVIGCTLVLAMSMAAPVLSSFDLYGYVHDALLGFGGYAPVDVPFTGEYHVFDLWLVTPKAIIYGPLWIPIVKLATALPATLVGKMLAYRTFSLGLFLAMLGLMRALGLPRRIVVVTACNPALAWLFVANAHNDLIAICLILTAAVFVRRSAALAVLPIVLAGTFKVPYVLLALPVLYRVKPAPLRYAWCALAIVATVLLTWLGGGAAYAHAVAHYAGSMETDAVHAVPFVVAAIAVLVAVAGGRRFRTAVWMFPVFGAFRLPVIFPWYAIFGLPYAIARHNVARYLLVSFPLATALITPELLRPWTLLVVIPFAVLASLRWSERYWVPPRPPAYEAAAR